MSNVEESREGAEQVDEVEDDDEPDEWYDRWLTVGADTLAHKHRDKRIFSTGCAGEQSFTLARSLIKAIRR